MESYRGDAVMFMKSDQVQADKEQDCFGYSIQTAIEHYLKGEFKNAAIHLENASRSSRELDRLKNQKQMHDEAWFLLKQIETQQQQRELVYKMQVNIYE